MLRNNYRVSEHSSGFYPPRKPVSFTREFSQVSAPRIIVTPIIPLPFNDSLKDLLSFFIGFKQKSGLLIDHQLPIPPNIPASQRGEPNTPDFPDVKLPQLFTGLKWESSQKKILLFTSGKRRIEVEGFHLESSQQSAFPQEFINYYIADLKDKGFKETLNSIDPDGITVTYSNNEIFMTFGVKNIYTGKGDVKKISGYKAFIEHN